jgi:cytoskeletal protein CcmA (bactofilin family)
MLNWFKKQEQISSSIIAKGTNITGNISSDGELFINGIVKGDVINALIIHIEEDGIVECNIIADEIYISGNFKGDILAHAVSIIEGAIVKGNIDYKNSLRIDESSKFSGCITLVENENSDIDQ